VIAKTMDLTDMNAGASERVRYLEAKVAFLKQHCEHILDASATRGSRAQDESLSRLLDIERARSNRLSEELSEVRAHRDDVVRQIEHQREHVLNLTRQLERVKGLVGPPNSLRRRMLKGLVRF
jgi:uncharacterized coiled-coil DUF342 family protein